MKQSLIFMLFAFCSYQTTAQFNNYYLTDNNIFGTGLCIEENELLESYMLATLYGNLMNEELNCSLLELNYNGDLINEHLLSDYYGDYLAGAKAGFFKTSDNGFIYALGIDGPIIFKFNPDMSIAWIAQEDAPSNYYYWGGAELGNGDLIFGYDIPNTPYNILPMRRYSSTGEFLFEFNIELDYNYGYPTSFLARDEFVYVSFLRHLISDPSYRRNYISCYNAVTGEEIWEIHQIESNNIIGYKDPFLFWNVDNELQLLYSQIDDAQLPTGSLIGGLYTLNKVAKINIESGEIVLDTILSDLNFETTLFDVEATDDFGIVILAFGFEEPPNINYSAQIIKIDADLNIEWMYNYSTPDLYYSEDVYEVLDDLEVTSDDCIIAAGYAFGPLPDFSDQFQFPWVLKIDACGNEIVSDCELSNIGERDLNATIQVYPNPAKDRIYLKGNESIKRAEIFDLQGRKIFEENFSGAHEQTLFIDNIPPGLYLTHTTTQSGKTRSVKIIIE